MAEPTNAGQPVADAQTQDAGSAAQGGRGPDGKFTAGSAAQPGTGAPGANAISDAAKAAVAARKLKIDDAEVDEDEVIKVYKDRKGHQRAANKEFQEGRAARKQSEEFIALMRDEAKVIDVLKKLGHDPRKLSEKYLAAQLEDDMLDPREKELRTAKAQLRELQDIEKKREDEVKSRRHEEMKAKFAKEYTETFVEALKKTQLPPTKPMVAEMAKYIARSAKIGFKMTPDEAAQLVKEDILVAHQRLIGDSDGEILLKLLGDNVANKIRKYDTDRLKNPEAMLRAGPGEQAETHRTRGEKAKRMTPAEWRRHKMGLA